MDSMSDVILVVEDDTDLQSLLEFTLGNEGFEVVTRDDGASALEYLNSEADPVCIVLDLLMPGIDGMEVLERRSQSPELASIPTIVLTGRDDDEVVQRAFDRGADDYVTKPFSPNELIARIQRLVE